MTFPGGQGRRLEEGLVTEADVRAAQVILDDLEAATGAPLGHRRDARGGLAVLVANVRLAGHVEGQQRGRLEAARLVRDALEAEGL